MLLGLFYSSIPSCRIPIRIPWWIGKKNGLSENYQPVLFSSGGFATPVKNWKVNIIGDRAQGILKTQFIVF